jgi:hypothetical protein
MLAGTAQEKRGCGESTPTAATPLSTRSWCGAVVLGGGGAGKSISGVMGFHGTAET